LKKKWHVSLYAGGAFFPVMVYNIEDVCRFVTMLFVSNIPASHMLLNTLDWVTAVIGIRG